MAGKGHPDRAGINFSPVAGWLGTPLYKFARAPPKPRRYSHTHTEMLAKLKEKFSNLSTVGKAVVLVSVAVILGGGCFVGYNLYSGKTMFGSDKVEEVPAGAEKDAKGKVEEAKEAGKGDVQPKKSLLGPKKPTRREGSS